MNIQNPFEEIADRLQRIENCLLAMKKDAPVPPDPADEVPITISEAAALINLSVPTLYGLTHRRKIPSYRKGKRLYFLKSELLAWLKAGRRSTIDEMKEDNGKSI